MNDPAPVIDVHSLSFAWTGGERALEDVTFVVNPGETVAVVGPSGAGKSTLLMHLNGLLPERLPQDDRQVAVSVCGTPVTAEHAAQIRQRVGFVFQDPDDQLFCPTVREDVAFGPLNLGLDREAVQERIEEGLKLAGLDGYGNRSTLQLSVGERKRVCLAGVLACRPEVLVLDEPFSNLDPRARRGLQQVLEEFPGSRILATHDLDLVVSLCDRVIVLDEGRVRADGAVRSILSNVSLMNRHGLEVPYQLRG